MFRHDITDQPWSAGGGALQLHLVALHAAARGAQTWGDRGKKIFARIHHQPAVLPQRPLGSYSGNLCVCACVEIDLDENSSVSKILCSYQRIHVSWHLLCCLSVFLTLVLFGRFCSTATAVILYIALVSVLSLFFYFWPKAHWTILILERKKHRLEFPVKTNFPARRRFWESPFRGQ